MRQKLETRESWIPPGKSRTATNKETNTAKSPNKTHLNLVRQNLTLAEGLADLDNSRSVEINQAKNVNPQAPLSAKLKDFFKHIEVHLGLGVVLPVNLKNIYAVGRDGPLHAFSDSLLDGREGVGGARVAKYAPLVRANRNHSRPRAVDPRSRDTGLPELPENDLGRAIMISYSFPEKHNCGKGGRESKREGRRCSRE